MIDEAINNNILFIVISPINKSFKTTPAFAIGIIYKILDEISIIEVNIGTIEMNESADTLL
jgi:hypothetical protein